MSQLNLIDIGPFTSEEAESIKEKMLENKTFSYELELLLRGHLTPVNFMLILQSLAQSIDQDLIEKRKEFADDCDRMIAG